MTLSTIMRQQDILDRRIEHFYDLLNRRRFDECYDLIDPLVRRDSASITLFQYQTALTSFMDHFGAVDVKSIAMALHQNELSNLYKDRDFAIGETVWVDRAGGEHRFSERWVRDGSDWYTRATGYVTPGLERISPMLVAGVPVERSTVAGDD